MYKTIKARILNITRDDMTFCSARVIRARLEDEKGKEHFVRMACSPTIIGPTVKMISRNSSQFDAVWNRSKAGDEVYLYHSDDENSTYFETIK